MTKLKDLEKRLEKEPDNLGLRVTVAGAMREAGRQAEAVELYRSVAVAYRDQGRSQQAIAVCRSILEIVPDDARCHALLASLVAQHKGRSARDTGEVYGDEIVLEVGTPPPPEKGRDRPPSIAPATGTGVGSPGSRTTTGSRSLTPMGTPVDPPGGIASRTTTPTGGISLPRSPTPPRPPAPRAPTQPPATTKAGVSVPLPDRSSPVPRRSSFDGETPLPRPLPYHVADPTTKSLKKLSEVDLLPTPDPDDLPASEDAKTRPGSDDGTRPGVKGIANAARRISSALIGVPQAQDLSIELDTRPRQRIESDELEKIAKPPPTVPVERLEIADDDDAVTAPPSITMNMRAKSNASDDDTEQEEEDDGVPTLNDDDQDEVTRPRDTALDVMIRTEAEGPLGSAFFQPLPHDRRDAVLARFHRKSVKKGTTVIRHGEVGHSLVVVMRGQLGVRVGTHEVRVVGTGEYIGEGSLLARAASPVHVAAIVDCELLVLPPRDFYEVAGAFPALWAELKDVAERRKRELEAILRRASP